MPESDKTVCNVTVEQVPDGPWVPLCVFDKMITPLVLVVHARESLIMLLLWAGFVPTGAMRFSSVGHSGWYSL